jgi:hypothetical protein
MRCLVIDRIFYDEYGVLSLPLLSSQFVTSCFSKIDCFIVTAAIVIFFYHEVYFSIVIINLLIYSTHASQHLLNQKQNFFLEKKIFFCRLFYTDIPISHIPGVQ